MTSFIPASMSAHATGVLVLSLPSTRSSPHLVDHKQEVFDATLLASTSIEVVQCIGFPCVFQCKHRRSRYFIDILDTFLHPPSLTQYTRSSANIHTIRLVLPPNTKASVTFMFLARNYSSEGIVQFSISVLLGLVFVGENLFVVGLFRVTVIIASSEIISFVNIVKERVKHTSMLTCIWSKTGLY